MEVDSEQPDGQQRMGPSAAATAKPVVNPREATLHAPTLPARFPGDRFDFEKGKYEWRRLFGELLGTFFLVLVAAGGGMVNPDSAAMRSARLRS